MFMCVTAGAPAVLLSSRTLGFFSSMFFFVSLCSAEDWVSSATGGGRLAGPSPCMALWLLKAGVRQLTRVSALSNLAAFDVGVSIFGPLSLNFVILARSRGQTGGKVLCLLEAAFGVALGNSELVNVATLFLVPFTLLDLATMAKDLPLYTFSLASSAIVASSRLSKEENRVKVAQLLRKLLLITDNANVVPLNAVE
jgi:hypothetical protein